MITKRDFQIMCKISKDVTGWHPLNVMDVGIEIFVIILQKNQKIGGWKI